MSTPRLEAFLALLYTDADALRSFAEDREAAARRAGLNAEEISAMLQVNAEDLDVAARSFARKRLGKVASAQSKPRLWERLSRGWLGKNRAIRGTPSA